MRHANLSARNPFSFLCGRFLGAAEVVPVNREEKFLEFLKWKVEIKINDVMDCFLCFLAVRNV